MSLAQGFRSDTGVSFDLLWDEELVIWNAYGVTSQHTVLVFDAAGNPIDGFRGWDANRVLDAL